MKGLLEVVGLELMAESIMAGTHSKSRREFQILGAATLKLREPNEVLSVATALAVCLSLCPSVCRLRLSQECGGTKSSHYRWSTNLAVMQTDRHRTFFAVTAMNE